MKRNLEIERTYFLGQYRNIKVFNSLMEIPEELANNDDALRLFRMLQLLEVERAFQEYKLMIESFEREELTSEKVLAMIDEMHRGTTKELEKIFKNGDIKDD